MQQFRELLEMGFTPAAALSITACGVLWLRMEMGNRKQARLRQEWHAATLARVEELGEHVQECNDDRDRMKEEAAKLQVQVARLTERNSRYANCPRKLCPMRLP